MGEKRRSNNHGNDRKKKYKSSPGIIDPSASGIYATCNRHQEKKCQNELRLLFQDKLQEMYADELAAGEGDEDEEEEELSIEDSIKKELEGLKEKKADPGKKEPIQFIDLGCECVVFCKTRRPIDPEKFVEAICKESFESKGKTTRFTQKLSPITFSCSASLEELDKLAQRVLKPHFHKEEGQEPHSFAIKVTSRNFSTISKDEIIQHVAGAIGKDHGHKVDLKKYEKLILVECFKNNIGMSVVNNYDKYQKYNLQQIYIKNQKADNESRVAKSKTESMPKGETIEVEAVAVKVDPTTDTSDAKEETSTNA